MQCKDIPDAPILKWLRDCTDLHYYLGATWLSKKGGDLFPNSVQHAMPQGVRGKLALAKMRQLMKRGLVDGCDCGCRGDFELTDKGRRYLEQEQ